ncbi:carboxymuconolactone decarboxylase family protein [Halalkalibacillus halophilus]|uniref:carboxymuconolactone decarboxylase family protein n=1 Tax=Halalkalibacillus halophilus TaxID=392827 RepID=UPI000413362D|nr:carboxymuconolactone decarboxylase family protein [Halalkalibacillus halophilus]
MTDETSHYYDEVILDYKEGLHDFKEALPKVVDSYFSFTESCFEDGSLSSKHKQLMALTTSIYAQDEYCIIYHAKGAAENGASVDEVSESIAVSAALGGGAALAQGATLAADAFTYFLERQ